MPWFHYQRGGWEIAVDAVSQRDAAEHIKRQSPEAEYLGEWQPSTTGAYSTATAMTTAKRQDQITNHLRG